MADISELCISCNMCCNGMIFAKVRVATEELEELRSDAKILNDQSGTYMCQPCIHQGEDGACEIYAKRPQTCHN